MSERIFISYRRSDCQSQANGLNDGLRNRLPDAQVFMDLDSIPPGADFEDHIRDYIQRCDVVLVLIGDEWLDPRPGSSTRRIDEPNDFVRLEVMTALEGRDVTVIPVLVEGASMPAASELPDDIARLARLNAYTLSDSHWGRDIQELTTHLRGAPEPAQVQPAPSGETVTFADIDANAVKYAVAELPHQFATKDVSTHPVMLATHEGVAGRSNYHTMVGRYLMQHRNDLGLGAPDAPRDDRGSQWTKLGTSRQQYPPVQPAQAAARPFTPSPPRPAAPASGGRPSAVGKWMIAVPLVSCGLLSFVPPLWAATQTKHDPTRQRRLFLIAGGLAAAMIAGFVLIGISPTDADGTATGPASDLGAVLLLVSLVAGVVVAVMNRNPRPVLAGTAEEMARRDLRQQYRQLAARDASLAASMRVGRPDTSREYDDGGLVDINNMPAEGLQRFGGLSQADAAEVVRARGELGRLTSLNELEAFANLSPNGLARLREIAVIV